MSTWTQLYLIFTWEFANSSESIREFSHQVISGFDALGLWCSCWGRFSCSCCQNGYCACWTSVGLSGLDSTVHLDHIYEIQTTCVIKVGNQYIYMLQNWSQLIEGSVLETKWMIIQHILDIHTSPKLTLSPKIKPWCICHDLFHYVSSTCLNLKNTGGTLV